MAARGGEPAAEVAARLMAGGFVAAEEEAEELVAAAAGDRETLEALVVRRLTGEPLAWITGTAPFCGLWIKVDPGVYVPRWQTEALAERAAELLPEDGTAIDLCTGSGAIPAYLKHRRPNARILATDIDPKAVACARSNGVEAYQADLFGDLGEADIVTAVVPYVPTPDLPLLQRDTFTFETTLSYDGGPDGTAILERVLAEAAGRVRVALLLELGGDQADLLGLDRCERILDEEGDVRGVCCRTPDLPVDNDGS
jgi:release factor glutamine methyltransferase